MSERMEPAAVMRAFREGGALLEGHFLLASGRHGDRYFEKALVLQRPDNVERMCREIARRYVDAKPDLVIGPTTLGVVLSYETAKNFGVRGIFAEREGDRRVLRRGFRIEAGERVLIVDDILTTGGSIRDVLQVVQEWGGVPVGIAVLVDRSSEGIDFGVRLESLLRFDVPTYDPANCPLCEAGAPLVKPGTTPRPGGAGGYAASSEEGPGDPPNHRRDEETGAAI